MVLKIYSECDKDIKEWEECFIAEHDRLPTPGDIHNFHVLLQFKQNHTAYELLNMWKIDVHS